MTAAYARRVARLEKSQKVRREPLLIVRRIVDPAEPNRVPDGIEAVPRYLSEIKREQGEGWGAFLSRVESLVRVRGAGGMIRAIAFP